MTPHWTLPVTPARTMLAMAGVSAAVLVATAWWWGAGSPTVWIAATAASAAVWLICLASLEVMLRMTQAGHGIASVFAGMLVRLACTMTLVLAAPAAVPQLTSLPILASGLVHMLMLNYLAGLAVETVVAARLASKFQPIGARATDVAATKPAA
ncbi:hypothetical protein Pla123a_27480 [Posidoniimonas polymericola]|uniref:ATP synthase I chain n=1 Tax=Posidoniimonas polymericola TaxID=2528002 RepID=A0A5C5YLW8_9BACT|nr:hypothetical protein [Posidoniimonas polymericola]TWT75963.1 hypothetical protein Pla123a_27480 [Posidoniimonas polymericola]